MNTLVSYQLNEGVATISMDDGKANALSLRMQAQIIAALDRAEADSAIVILTGRAGKFCAGFDLATLSKGGEEAARMLSGGFEIAERLLRNPNPVIVACSGHALAMGVFLLQCGDVILAADGDFKIGANEVAIGMTMPRSAIEICRARIAPAHLGRVLSNAEIYRPADAITAGFVDRVVPAADLLGEANAVAAQMAKLNRSAHGGTKKLVRAPLLQALSAAMKADEVLFGKMAGM